jgi:hypothetical protein
LIIFNTLLQHFNLRNDVSTSDFPNELLSPIIISPVRATYLAHIPELGEGHNNFLGSAVASSLLDPDIPLGTPSVDVLSQIQQEVTLRRPRTVPHRLRLSYPVRNGTRWWAHTSHATCWVTIGTHVKLLSME